MTNGIAAGLLFVAFTAAPAGAAPSPGLPPPPAVVPAAPVPSRAVVPVVVAPPVVVPRIPVPIALPHPPAVVNPTSSAITDALLAISRAQLSNPQGAQTAAFSYVKALQQYRSGDALGARESALAALAAASAPPLTAATPAPLPPSLLAPGAVQAPGTQGGLYGADAPAVDADSFLAVARGTLADCAARHDRALGGAQRHYARAADAFARHDWQITRTEAKAAIDACAQPRP